MKRQVVQEEEERGIHLLLSTVQQQQHKVGDWGREIEAVVSGLVP